MRIVVELFIRWIHLVAAMIWLGGVFFSLIITPAMLKRQVSLIDSFRHLSMIRDRLRVVIRVTIHVLLITGAMNFFIVAWNTRMDFSREYVVAFAVKMGFVGLMTLFHAVHISVFGRRLEEAVTEMQSHEADIPQPVYSLQGRARLFAILTVVSGLIVFALSLYLKGA